MKRLVLVLSACLLGSACSASPVQAPEDGPVLADGRVLTPTGQQVALGQYPTGAAVTTDGRYLWTVSTGLTDNGIRIVDTTSGSVCQRLDLPGASGGIAIDSDHRLVYVSGLANSRWTPSKDGLPGADGDVVHVIKYTSSCGQATELRTIPVPPQKDAPALQAYPPPRSGLAATTTAWPQKLAVSPDGATLLVPLNLASAAAVVDVADDSVRYVSTGSYPYGAAILPDGRTGLVTNEASGTLSIVDLRTAVKVRDIAVGPPLSHPEGLAVSADGSRAFVAITGSDQVAVVDLADGVVETTLFVGRSAGLGTQPVSVALSPDGSRLFVADAGSDEIVVIRVPDEADAEERDADQADPWHEVGRIPTADQPQAVLTAQTSQGAVLDYVSAEGMGVGANADGPDPTDASDPIFWAFDPKAPTTDIFSGVSYNADLVVGTAGLMALPDDTEVVALTGAADDQQRPADATAAPVDTVLRPDGPIEHVFFLVRENRSYDQLLGDVARGNGDPKLTVFGEDVTPNLHALVSRFPLLDGVLANSEASIQGHYWTSAAYVPDYVNRNWVQQYAGRGRPNDFGSYAVTWPGNGYLFTQADKQGITYANYGEAFNGGFPEVEDRDRTPEVLAQQKQGAGAQRHRPALRRLLPGRPDDRDGAGRRRDLRLVDAGRGACGQLLPRRLLPGRLREAAGGGRRARAQLPVAHQRPHARHAARVPDADGDGRRQRSGDRADRGPGLALVGVADVGHLHRRGRLAGRGRPRQRPPDPGRRREPVRQARRGDPRPLRPSLRGPLDRAHHRPGAAEPQRPAGDTDVRRLRRHPAEHRALHRAGARSGPARAEPGSRTRQHVVAVARPRPARPRAAVDPRRDHLALRPRRQQQPAAPRPRCVRRGRGAGGRRPRGRRRLTRVPLHSASPVAHALRFTAWSLT